MSIYIPTNNTSTITQATLDAALIPYAHSSYVNALVTPLQTELSAATPLNTASTLVIRDSQGSFAGNTGSFSGLYSNSIESLGLTLNIGNQIGTSTLNLGTQSSIVNVGVAAGSTLNLGSTTSNVLIQGTLIYEKTTNLEVTNKNITLNASGAAGSSFGAGILISDGATTNAGSILVTNDRLGYVFQAPAQVGTYTMNQDISSTATPTFTTVNVTSDYLKNGVPFVPNIYTELTATDFLVTNMTGTNGFITNLGTINMTGSQGTITNLSTTSFTGTNGFITNLGTNSMTGSSAIISSITGTTAYFTKISTTTLANSSDNSIQVPNNAFVQNAIRATMATIPMNNIIGGTYSFNSIGLLAKLTIGVTAGSVTSITSWSLLGSGYKVGDLITPAAGNYDAIIRIDAINGSNQPTAGTILYGGSGYLNPVLIGVVISIPTGFTLTFTGTLTSNAIFLMPFGSLLAQSNQWIFNNNTTGSFSLTIAQGTTGNVQASGRFVIIPQGTNNSNSMFIQSDGLDDVDIAQTTFNNLYYTSSTGSNSNVTNISCSNFTGTHINCTSITGGNVTFSKVTVNNDISCTSIDAGYFVKCGEVSYFDPTGKGSYMGYNRDGSSNKTAFMNQNGGSTGGYEWFQFDGNDALLNPSPLMSLDTTGSLILPGKVSATGFTGSYGTFTNSTITNLSSTNFTGTNIHYNSMTGVTCAFTDAYMSGVLRDGSGNKILTSSSSTNNVTLGLVSGNSLSTGLRNTAGGYGSMLNNISNNDNTTYGYGSGETVGTQCTMIGSGADCISVRSNAMSLGYGALVNVDNTCKIGNDSLTTIIANTGCSLGTLSIPMKTVYANSINSSSGIQGVTDNSLATVGYVGQLVTATTNGAPVNISDNTIHDLVNISLTAGDWTVNGFVNFDNGAGGSTTVNVAWINSVTRTIPSVENYSQIAGLFSGNVSRYVSLIPPFQVYRLSSTTTVYLSAQATAGSNAYGKIMARRER